MDRKVAIDYIKKTRSAGFSNAEIRAELERSGWSQIDIDQAFTETSIAPKIDSTTISPIEAPIGRPKPFVKDEPSKSKLVEVSKKSIEMKETQTNVRPPFTSFAQKPGHLEAKPSTPEKALQQPGPIEINPTSPQPTQIEIKSEPLVINPESLANQAPIPIKREPSVRKDPVILPEEQQPITSEKNAQTVPPLDVSHELKEPVHPKSLPEHTTNFPNAKKSSEPKTISNEAITIDKEQPTEQTTQESQVSYDEIKPKPIPISKVPNSEAPTRAPVGKIEDRKEPFVPTFTPRANIMELRKKEVVDKKDASTPIQQSSRPNMIKLGSNKKKIAAVGALFLLMVSGASAGYWYWFTEIRPASIVREGLQGLAKMKSFHFDAELVVRSGSLGSEISNSVEPLLPPFAGLAFSKLVQATPEASADQSFTMRAKGSADFSQESNPRQEMILTLGTKSILGSNIEFESKLSDGTYYFRFLHLPPFDSRTFIAEDYIQPFTTTSLIKKWVSFNPESFQEELAKYSENLAIIDPRLADISVNVEDGEDLISKDQIQRSQELWQNSSFIIWEDKVFPEDVNGEFAYRSKGRLDKTELIRFMEKVAQINETYAEVDPAEYDALGDIEVNAWVSEKTRDVLKLSAQTTITDTITRTAEISELIFTTYISEINEPVEFGLPSDAYDLINILEFLFADEDEEAEEI